MKKHKKEQADSEYALVYSTDPPKEKRCGGCLRVISECVCAKSAMKSLGGLKPAARIERKGRNGKSVTVIFKLPPHEAVLKKLLSHLKQSLGCGGTYYVKEGEGFIEVQGEHDQTAPGLIARFQEK